MRGFLRQTGMCMWGLPGNGQAVRRAAGTRRQRRRLDTPLHLDTLRANGAATPSTPIDGAHIANGSSSSSTAAGSRSALGARSEWRHPRAPLDDRFILGVALQQSRHLFLAAVALLLCVASNLASPILSGALFETLVHGQPFSRRVVVPCKLWSTCDFFFCSVLQASVGHASPTLTHHPSLSFPCCLPRAACPQVQGPAGSAGPQLHWRATAVATVCAADDGGSGEGAGCPASGGLQGPSDAGGLAGRTRKAGQSMWAGLATSQRICLPRPT